MTATKVSIDHRGIPVYFGLSTDTKPTNVPDKSKFWETDTGELYLFHNGSWHIAQLVFRKIAGEEQENSDFDSQLRIQKDYKSGTVDHATDPDTLYSGPCRLGKIFVNETVTNDSVVIQDDTTDKFTIPAGTTAGTIIDMEGERFETSIVANWGGSITAGNLTIQYREAEFA